MASLNGKVAIVTGASSGIGEATARALAEAGASVVLAARRVERLQALSQELQGQGVQVLVCNTDVTQRTQVEEMVAQTKQKFGRIDILINNAGVMLLSFAKKLMVDEWERMIDVNLKGLMFCTAAALPLMIEQNQGHVVNVSSVAGRRVFQTGAVYCATKFAVNAFTEGLRQELAPEHNIRFTLIEPGVVATELTDHISDQEVVQNFKKMRGKLVPLESEDIAESIVYAVSAHPRANVGEILVLPTNQR